jgi:hypothetical protein
MSAELFFLLFVLYPITLECEQLGEEEEYAETNFKGNMYLLL